MNSVVLGLQQELLKPDCDILNALRKANLIASKLGLCEFDVWIQSELNGYSENIPDYRKIYGEIKAWNPYCGWIPVIFDDSEIEKNLCIRKISESVSDIIELYHKSKGHIIMNFPADVAKIIDSMCDVPFQTKYALHISKHLFKSIVDRVANCLLEWTLKLEKEGILGENMMFSESESSAARELPQQVNNYYGTVVNGDISKSQIASGNNNALTYSAEAVVDVIREIQEALEREDISKETKECAIEILEDISTKVDQRKNRGIIKAAFLGLKDFLFSAGANVVGALITAKIEGLF